MQSSTPNHEILQGSFPLPHKINGVRFLGLEINELDQALAQRSGRIHTIAKNPVPRDPCGFSSLMLLEERDQGFFLLPTTKVTNRKITDIALDSEAILFLLKCLRKHRNLTMDWILLDRFEEFIKAFQLGFTPEQASFHNKARQIFLACVRMWETLLSKSMRSAMGSPTEFVSKVVLRSNQLASQMVLAGQGIHDLDPVDVIPPGGFTSKKAAKLFRDQLVFKNNKFNEDLEQWLENADEDGFDVSVELQAIRVKQRQLIIEENSRRALKKDVIKAYVRAEL